MPTAQRIGGAHHGFGPEGAVVTGGQRVDPLLEMRADLQAEATQVVVGAVVLGQAAVVELFASPGRFAKRHQPDHASAAFERVEGAAHGGQCRGVVVFDLQLRQGLACALQHFMRFFEEHLAHLGVVFEPTGHDRRRCARCGGRAHRGLEQGPWHGQRLRQHRDRSAGPRRHRIGWRFRLQREHRQAMVAVGCRRPGWQAANCTAGCTTMGSSRCSASRPALRHPRLLDDAVELQRDGQRVGVGGGALALAETGVELVETGRPVLAGHHRRQVAGLGIEAEQRLGHLRLHADHVDQEAQRAQIVGQPVEGAGLDGVLRVDFGVGQRVDVVAHAQHRLRSLVEPQHRQHTAHRRQLRRHRDQHLALGRVAEVLVDVLLDLGQRGAQLLHHAAHGLAVGNAAVQLLHPEFERAGVALLAHRVDALRQPRDPLGAVGMVEVAIVERGVQKQQRGGHFHRHLGRRLAATGHGVGRGHLQRTAQHGTVGIQAAQRIGDQRKLLGQAGQARCFTACDGRPHFLGRGHAFACLCHPGRVVAAQPGVFVVDRHARVQAVALPHSGQARADVGTVTRRGLTAEKQQVVRQAL